MPAPYSDRPLTEKSPTRIDQVPVSQPTASGFEVIHEKSPASISPAMIRPHLKAEARIETRKGRQNGRYRILTDTPEKQEIENINAKKHVSTKFNQAESINLSGKNRLMGKSRLNNAKNIKRRILSETEIREDSYNYSTSDTSEGVSDNNSEDENLQVEHVNKENYNIGDCVIFLYEGPYFVER